MSEEDDFDSQMFDSVLGYVFQKTRNQFESKLEDPTNIVIAQIFSSTNYQEFFSRIESGNLIKNDYNLFLEYYFSGEMGFIPPGVPPELLPTKLNEWDPSGLRKYFGMKVEPNISILEGLDTKELMHAWVQLYSNPEKTDLSEIPETRDRLIQLLRIKPPHDHEEKWLSSVFLLVRKCGRLYYKQGMRRPKSGHDARQLSKIDGHLSPAWLLKVFRKAEQIGETFQTDLAQQSMFLFGYERAIVLNYLGAHERAVDTLKGIQDSVKEQHNWASSKVVHPVLEDPGLYLSMFSNLTKSWCGKDVDLGLVKDSVAAAIAMSNSSKKRDEFAINAGAVVHYYSLLTLFNNGSLSLLTDVKHPWKRFREMHPDFYSNRTIEYIDLSRSPNHPWSEKLREGYLNLISESNVPEQHQIDFHNLVRDKNPAWGHKNLDLSSNNPLSSYDGGNPSFADQINNWNAYIDMIHINQLRTTKKGSHHFDHYGPLKSETGSWLWLTPSPMGENKKSTTKQGQHPYFFEQYLSQSFRSHSKPKSTKMDRMNLMAMTLRKLAQRLEDYVPKTIRGFVDHNILRRLQKPILTLEKDMKDKPVIMLYPSLHTHVALDRVLSLNGVLSSVVGMLQLTTIQASYRNGITSILDKIQEQISLEFIHLMVIVKSPKHLQNGYLAVGEVNKIRRRLGKEKRIHQYQELNDKINMSEERLWKRAEEDRATNPSSESFINRHKKVLQDARDQQDEIVLELSQYDVSREELDNTRSMKFNHQRFRFNENQLLSDDYLTFEFKQFDSAAEYVNRYISDERADSIIALLSKAPWWKFDLATIDEEKLAQTIVAWIRYRAEEDPIAKIHPRSRGGK